MLDEARYFKGKEQVKLLLDQMALLKMNVFHWHLTDDAGWRIEIKKYPKLVEIGSKRKDSQIIHWSSDKTSGQPHAGYYTQEDIKEAMVSVRSMLAVGGPKYQMILPAEIADTLNSICRSPAPTPAGRLMICWRSRPKRSRTQP